MIPVDKKAFMRKLRKIVYDRRHEEEVFHSLNTPKREDIEEEISLLGIEYKKVKEPDDDDNEQ